MIKGAKKYFALMLTFVFPLSAAACGEVHVVLINKEPASSEAVAASTEPASTTSVNDGTAQIGLLSRDLKEQENAADFDRYIIGFE